MEIEQGIEEGWVDGETGKLGKEADLPVAVLCGMNEGGRGNLQLVSKEVQISCPFLQSATTSSFLSLISSSCSGWRVRGNPGM